MILGCWCVLKSVKDSKVSYSTVTAQCDERGEALMLAMFLVAFSHYVVGPLLLNPVTCVLENLQGSHTYSAFTFEGTVS